jgi:Alr-MurF fusion protein
LTLSLRNIIPIIKANFSNENTIAIIDSISIDSRSNQNGAETLFFALVGPNYDGHNYIEELIDKGVKYFVVSKIPTNLKDKACFLVVENTLEALQNLATYYRRLFDFPVIGITGSNGKTIIKEWLNFLLSPDYNVIRSPKSYNSQVGVPLSILGINEKHNLGIFEAGISTRDEMENLQKIIQPNIGILSGIGSAHDEGFHDIGEKIKEKTKLFTDVEVLILNKNRTIFAFLNQKIKTFTWSSDDKSADVFVMATENEDKTELKITYNELCFKVIIPFRDQASIENAMHCLMTMLYLGYHEDVIQQRLQHLYPIEMRLKVKKGKNNTTIIDDSYSSDYQSLKIALDFLESQKQHKKKTIIISDIIQSGLFTEELYSRVSQLIVSNKINRVITIGSTIYEYKSKFPNCYSYKTLSDFLDAIDTFYFNNERCKAF